MKFIIRLFLLITLLTTISCTKSDSPFDKPDEDENSKKSLGVGISGLYGKWKATSGKSNPLGFDEMEVSPTSMAISGEGLVPESGSDDMPVTAGAGKAASTSKAMEWGYNWRNGRYEWHNTYGSTTTPTYRPSTGGGSTGDEGIEMQRAPYTFYMLVGKDSDSPKEYYAHETVISPISGIQVPDLSAREDLYLIREVGDNVYLDICECSDNECDDDNVDRCYEVFESISESNESGMFYKVN